MASDLQLVQTARDHLGGSGVDGDLNLGLEDFQGKFEFEWPQGELLQGL